MKASISMMKALVCKGPGKNALEGQLTPLLHVVGAMKEGATLAFEAHAKVKPDIELQPLSSTNDIFERLQNGDVASRAVLDSSAS